MNLPLKNGSFNKGRFFLSKYEKSDKKNVYNKMTFKILYAKIIQ